VQCGPDTSIQEAARQMSAAGTTAVVVDLGSSLGIVTDRDLRSRVLAAGRPPDTPVSLAMTAPAETVAADRPAGEVLLDMLDRGFRHFPVVSATGEILGIIADSDLVAEQTRSSFSLRQAISRAATVAELQQAAAALRPTVVSLHRAHLASLDIQAVYSVVSDALTRRALEFALEEAGKPPLQDGRPSRARISTQRSCSSRATVAMATGTPMTSGGASRQLTTTFGRSPSAPWTSSSAVAPIPTSTA
jgi:CBS domain-containing protein